MSTSKSLSFPQVAKGYDTLIEQGVTPELWQDKFLGDGLLADVAEAAVKGTLPKDRSLFRQLLGLVVTIIYKIVVDYTKSLEQMIAAGCYDWVNPDITAERFPITGDGQVELEPELIHIGRDMSSDEVIADLDKRGLRPGTIAELLAFGATYPEVQREFPIVALGSVAEVHGYRRVACLYRSDSERNLHLDWFDSDWDGLYRFLAFRKLSGS